MIGDYGISKEILQWGAAASRLERAVVDWYGATRRAVEIKSGQGHWYNPAKGWFPSAGLSRALTPVTGPQ